MQFSKRDELEITDLNNSYLKDGKLKVNCYQKAQFGLTLVLILHILMHVNS